MAKSNLEDVTSIVTDDQIKEAFEGAKFGDENPRDLIKMCLLKNVCEYRDGHTITQICINLGLLSKRSHNISKQGKNYLWAAFS